MNSAGTSAAHIKSPHFHSQVELGVELILNTNLYLDPGKVILNSSIILKWGEMSYKLLRGRLLGWKAVHQQLSVV